MKKIFSGIQPTNVIHIGNYLGALKNWVALQDEGDAIYCIVDLHAITVPQEPEVLKEKILEVAALFIACGVDSDKATLFVQSSRPEHSELAWILNCYTSMGELNRMTQFKEKGNILPIEAINKELSQFINHDNSEHANMLGKIQNVLATTKSIPDSIEKAKLLAEELDVVLKLLLHLQKYNLEFVDRRASINSMKAKAEMSVSAGLFDYPVLMAADILLYQTTHVPVGEDQKQHIEITRDIAGRFNNKYACPDKGGSQTFTMPEPIIKQSTARIMGLDDPTKKMSKSSPNPSSYIALTDSPDTIKDKIKRAVTDSGSEIKADPSGQSPAETDPSDKSAVASKPAITNLLNIFSGMSGREVAEIEKEFAGKGYGEFKEALAEAIIAELAPIQDKFNSLMADKEHLRKILADGSAKIAPIAQQTLKDVKSKIGLG